MTILDLIIGYLITIISLLIGYNLGRHGQGLSPTGQQRLTSILKRTAPKSEGVGVITRPTAEDNYYRDHPQAAKERDEMEKTVERLQE